MATSSRHSSIVRRLSARAAVWASIVGLTLAGVAVWQYWRVSRQALDARLVEDARALAHAITANDDGLEVELSSELRAALAIGESYYGVYDAEGRLLDGDAPALDAGGDALRPGVRTLAGHREVVVAALPGVAVRVGRPLAPLHADVGRLAASMLLAIVVAALLAAPLTVWLRRELARSISRIDSTARALAPGQPARIDLAQLDEEFTGVGRRLNEAFDRLEGALTREQQLTADASHELRTPVATIVTETQWALAQPRSLQEYRRALEVCARQGRRLKELVEALLALARLEGGAMAPAWEPLELEALAEAAAADVEGPARTRRVTIEREGRAAVYGDRVQLGILLSNLLSNAVRYNNDGGRVRVLIEPGDQHATITVSDTGPGLDPAVADRVFDRFWRASPSRAAHEGGTGLGLAISKAVVDAHGGTIACTTGAGGTTFVITLPTTPDTGSRTAGVGAGPPAAEPVGVDAPGAERSGGGSAYRPNR